MVSFANVPSALLGGLLIGAGAALLLLVNGRIAGVSGIISGLFVPERGMTAWRAAFLLGLLLVGVVASRVAPERLPAPSTSLRTLALAGVLVGVGTRLARGCTSGHGVCGIGRLSLRSTVATAVFVLGGMLTVHLVGAP